MEGATNRGIEVDISNNANILELSTDKLRKCTKPDYSKNLNTCCSKY